MTLPAFELVSDPTLNLRYARAYLRGDMTWEEAASNAVDKVTGLPVDGSALLAMAVLLVRTREIRDVPSNG